MTAGAPPGRAVRYRPDVAHRTFDRSPWLLDPDISFLNHGSFGACPEPVLEAQRAWRDRMEQEPVRFLDRELEGHLDQARTEVAAFLGADPDGLAFVANATTRRLHGPRRSLRFKPGDELLASDHEYNATLNALRARGRTGWGDAWSWCGSRSPSRIPRRSSRRTWTPSRPRTRFALVSHVTSPTALVLPGRGAGPGAGPRGASTRSWTGRMPRAWCRVDLEALGAAYWTGNGHKWLCAPKGAAVLHVRADMRARDPPAGDLARRERRPARSLAVPARVRLDGDGGSHAVALRSPPRSGTSEACIPSGWPGLMAANEALALARPGTGSAPRSGSSRPPPMRCWDPWPRCRSRASCPREPRRRRSRRRCSTRIGSRCRSIRSRSRRRSRRAACRPR